MKQQIIEDSAVKDTLLNATDRSITKTQYNSTLTIGAIILLFLSPFIIMGMFITGLYFII